MFLGDAIVYKRIFYLYIIWEHIIIHFFRNNCNFTMRIIAKKALREFWERHPDAKAPLETWYDQVRQQDWDTPAKVKERWPRASVVGNDRVVFRIKGNAFRLVVRIFYPGRQVFIRFVGTHTEYNRINAKEV